MNEKLAFRILMLNEIQEVSQIYGLEVPLLQEDRGAFLKRFFSSQPFNIEGDQVIRTRS